MRIPVRELTETDRKSTRLNSSHPSISYAVFCLNATATTEIYTLSLHDALPICWLWPARVTTGRTRIRPAVRSRGKRSGESKTFLTPHLRCCGMPQVPTGAVLYANPGPGAYRNATTLNRILTFGEVLRNVRFPGQ